MKKPLDDKPNVSKTSRVEPSPEPKLCDTPKIELKSSNGPKLSSGITLKQPEGIELTVSKDPRGILGASLAGGDEVLLRGISPSVTKPKNDDTSEMIADKLRSLTENILAEQRSEQRKTLETYARFQMLGIESSDPEPTEEQRADYKKFWFLCKDQIELTGRSMGYKQNEVIINGNSVPMSDSSFEILARLGVQLKSVEGGWIHTDDLIEEGLVTKENYHRSFSQLRKEIRGSLRDKKSARKLIENDGSKRYRLSVHPDFVQIASALAELPDANVRKMRCGALDGADDS